MNISTSSQSLNFLSHVWQFLNSLGIRIAPFCAFFWREQRWRRSFITSVVELTENSAKVNFSLRPQIQYATWLLFEVVNKLMEYLIVTSSMNFARHVHELRFPLTKLRNLRSLVSKERIDVNWFSLFESWKSSEFVSKMQNLLSC